MLQFLLFTFSKGNSPAEDMISMQQPSDAQSKELKQYINSSKSIAMKRLCSPVSGAKKHLLKRTGVTGIQHTCPLPRKSVFLKCKTFLWYVFKWEFRRMSEKKRILLPWFSWQGPCDYQMQHNQFSNVCLLCHHY